MDRMGHAQVQTTQKHLHTLPNTDQRNLDALTPHPRPTPITHRRESGDGNRQSPSRPASKRPVRRTALHRSTA
jgi:hypothetical protein